MCLQVILNHSKQTPKYIFIKKGISTSKNTIHIILERKSGTENRVDWGWRREEREVGRANDCSKDHIHEQIKAAQMKQVSISLTYY